MTFEERIKEAYASAKNYPDLVQKLIHLGVHSYTVDVASSTILYRLAKGVHHLHFGDISPRTVSIVFDQALTIQAVRDNQQGKTDYPGFMDAIARAGVRFYEATLQDDMRVTYIGSTGVYEEKIPR